MTDQPNDTRATAYVDDGERLHDEGCFACGNPNEEALVFGPAGSFRICRWPTHGSALWWGLAHDEYRRRVSNQFAKIFPSLREESERECRQIALEKESARAEVLRRFVERQPMDGFTIDDIDAADILEELDAVTFGKHLRDVREYLAMLERGEKEEPKVERAEEPGRWLYEHIPWNTCEVPAGQWSHHSRPEPPPAAPVPSSVQGEGKPGPGVADVAALHEMAANQGVVRELRCAVSDAQRFQREAEQERDRLRHSMNEQQVEIARLREELAESKRVNGRLCEQMDHAVADSIRLAWKALNAAGVNDCYVEPKTWEELTKRARESIEVDAAPWKDDNDRLTKELAKAQERNAELEKQHKVDQQDIAIAYQARSVALDDKAVVDSENGQFRRDLKSCLVSGADAFVRTENARLNEELLHAKARVAELEGQLAREKETVRLHDDALNKCCARKDEVEAENARLQKELRDELAKNLELSTELTQAYRDTSATAERLQSALPFIVESAGMNDPAQRGAALQKAFTILLQPPTASAKEGEEKPVHSVEPHDGAFIGRCSCGFSCRCPSRSEAIVGLELHASGKGEGVAPCRLSTAKTPKGPACEMCGTLQASNVPTDAEFEKSFGSVPEFRDYPQASAAEQSTPPHERASACSGRRWGFCQSIAPRQGGAMVPQECKSRHGNS